MKKNDLALFGGSPVTAVPFPNRRQFQAAEKQAAMDVFEHYERLNRDFSGQGHFEDQYTSAFVKFLGSHKPGFCDGVSSGTACLYVILQSLSLHPGSEILVSPITDPGMISPIFLLGHHIRVCDNEAGSAHVSLKSVRDRVTPKTKVLVLNHLSGMPIPEIALIAEFCESKNIILVEDASQAHGAEILGRKVGTFGMVSYFSTMFSKNHSSGGRGGLIYTEDEALFRKIRSNADKGKNFHQSHFNEKNPALFSGPALNFGMDEISASIGLSTLKKLNRVNDTRNVWQKKLAEELRSRGTRTRLILSPHLAAPYFGIFHIDPKSISTSKVEFAEAIKAEGMTINSDYKYLVSDWSWVERNMKDHFYPAQAAEFLASTFNLLFHEFYGDHEINCIVEAILKVESVFGQ